MNYWDFYEWLIFISIVMAGINGTIALFERVKNSVVRRIKEKREYDAQMKKYIEYYIEHQGK